MHEWVNDCKSAAGAMQHIVQQLLMCLVATVTAAGTLSTLITLISDLHPCAHLRFLLDAEVGMQLHLFIVKATLLQGLRAQPLQLAEHPASLNANSMQRGKAD
jgi:hypothetical protein